MTSQHGRRQPVFTPALEGSKNVVPLSAQLPGDHLRALSRGGQNRPRGMSGGFYPGRLPPIPPGYMNVMPGERYGYPGGYSPYYAMRSPRYMGPPSLLPMWGGYSLGPNYYQETTLPTDKPAERKPQYTAPRQMPPMVPPAPIRPSPPPQRPKIIPVPILVKRQKPAVPRIIKPPKKSVRRKIKRSKSGQNALSRFRYVAYAVAFTEILKSFLRKMILELFVDMAKKNLNNRPNSMFLFGIILKEIVAALHRIYLNPSGNIYPVLNDVIGPNSYDLSALVHGGQLGEREEAVLVQELQYVIENLIYHVTEIMPSQGVLGTHRKSAVFELIRGGKRFPDGYFWQVEMDRLQFTDQGRTTNNGDAESFLLLTGIFISRSLITTLLMKPVDYGLSSEPLTETGERNLRIIASTLLYLVRRIAISRAQGVMPMPSEISRYLYDDAEMQHIYSRLSRTFNYCEGLLREWGTEYVRRLRASTVQQQ